MPVSVHQLLPCGWCIHFAVDTFKVSLSSVTLSLCCCQVLGRSAWHRTPSQQTPCLICSSLHFPLLQWHKTLSLLRPRSIGLLKWDMHGSCCRACSWRELVGSGIWHPNKGISVTTWLQNLRVIADMLCRYLAIRRIIPVVQRCICLTLSSLADVCVYVGCRHCKSSWP